MESKAKNLTWEEFKKVEMRVATIVAAQVFEKANKPAYILTLDFGPFGIIKSSAQITQLYSVTDLIGKQVIAVVNFPPKQIANIQSECLVLGAIDSVGVVTLLQPERVVENGAEIG